MSLFFSSNLSTQDDNVTTDMFEYLDMTTNSAIERHASHIMTKETAAADVLQKLSLCGTVTCIHLGWPYISKSCQNLLSKKYVII